MQVALPTWCIYKVHVSQLINFVWLRLTTSIKRIMLMLCYG